MDVQLLTAGYCTQLEMIAKAKGRLKTIRFPATFAFISHPIHGPILFDTGYSEHVLKAMRQFPFQLYKWATPVYFQKGESAKEQLNKQGISAESVRYIILSHFHADHMGGLQDFPNAKFICSKKELEEVQAKKGFRALKRAYIPSLLPTDFCERAIYVEDLAVVQTPIFADIYPEAIDLFGDQSILAIFLRGHTSEQFGIFLNDCKQHLFFVADACWLSETYEQLVFPSSIAKRFMGLNESYDDNIYKLHEIHTKYPHIKIIPCHEANVTFQGGLR